MVIVGEKLNSSLHGAYQIFEKQDEQALLALARAQLDRGADYLDVNCAMMKDEKASLMWATRILDSELGCPLMLDSPDMDALAFVYESVHPEKTIINSVSLEPDRLDAGLALVLEYGADVLAMPIGDKGMPKSAEDRIAASKELIDKITEKGIAIDRIYVDLIVEACAADAEAPLRSIEAARVLRKMYPAVHLIAGLSNVSFGMPKRWILNSAFACCLLAAGADSLILDPLKTDVMLSVRACELMLGKDEYCMEYITACREAAEEA